MAVLNYHHLRLFHVIAHADGLTRAAARLNLSQSALSAQLKTLEAHLGHHLFERRGRRLVLTEAGRVVLEHADAIFAVGEDLLRRLDGAATAGRAVLRVGALATLSRNFQLDFLRPLMGRSDVELVVRSGSLRDLLAQLEAHVLDVVLTNSDIRRDERSTLHSHRLDQQPVSLVGRPRPGRGPIRFPEDLTGERVLLPSLDSDIRMAFDRLLALAGVHPLVVAEVDDMAMLRLLARESDGLTLAPPVVVRDELDAGLLVEHCRVPALHETFHAITAVRRFPNPLLRTLLERS